MKADISEPNSRLGSRLQDLSCLNRISLDREISEVLGTQGIKVSRR